MVVREKTYREAGKAAWKISYLRLMRWGFPGGSEVKASACNAGDSGSIPGSGRSPGEGNGTPLQYSCLENPMDVGAWWATVHRVAKSRTRLSDFTITNEIENFPYKFMKVARIKLNPVT